MFSFSLLIQGLIAVIVIGIFHNLWVTTRLYGGLIGAAVRFLGIGILLITIAVLEKVFVNFSIIEATGNLILAQDIFNLLGLFFLARGFSKLAAAAKS